MRRMIEQGVAASVGLRSKSVSVTSVAAARDGDGRELSVCGESRFGLEIESASGGAEQLKTDLQQAFTEGGVVTYVKAAAAELGILTQCLKDQKKELPRPVVQETAVVRKVVVQKRATAENPIPATLTNEPTDAPTEMPTNLPTFSPADDKPADDTPADDTPADDATTETPTKTPTKDPHQSPP